jgi:hypothetical protein
MIPIVLPASSSNGVFRKVKSTDLDHSPARAASL